jgi:hypothetical protein
MMEILVNQQLPEGLRTSSSYILELVMFRHPDLFIPESLALQIFDVCVNLFSELAIAREILQKAALIFGGTAEFAFHCSQFFSSFEGQNPIAFDILGICFADCVSHFEFESIIPSLQTGISHPNPEIRSSAFSMLSKILTLISDDDTPILEIILQTLSIEMNPIALSSEFSALSKFTKHCLRPSVHPILEIINICDHYFPTDNKLLIISCYRNLVNAGCRLSDCGISFLISILEGPPRGPVFFKVLSGFNIFVKLFPSFTIPENWDFEPQALLVFQKSDPDVLSAAFGKLLESKTVARKLLLNILQVVRTYPNIATEHEFALAELVIALVSTDLSERVIPIALKIARIAAGICRELPNRLIEPLVKLIERNPNHKAHILRTLANVIEILQVEEIDQVMEFAKEQIHRVAVDEQRWKTINDVRHARCDFEEKSVECAILDVVHSVEKHREYAGKLAGFLRSLFQYKETVFVKMTLMLAIDYVRLSERERGVIEEIIEYCERQLEFGIEWRYFTLWIVGVLIVQKVFDVQEFGRFMNFVIQIREEEKGNVELILLFGVVFYGEDCECREIEEFVFVNRDEITVWPMGELFPNEVAMAVVRLLGSFGKLSVKLGWTMALELLREKEKLDVEMQRYLSETLHAFEDGIEEIFGRIR